MAKRFDKSIRHLNRLLNEEVGKVVGDYAKGNDLKVGSKTFYRTAHKRGY